MTIFRNHGDNIIGAAFIVADVVALLWLLAPSNVVGLARAPVNAALHAVSSMCCTQQQK
jgi:hypothetical protein